MNTINIQFPNTICLIIQEPSLEKEGCILVHIILYNRKTSIPGASMFNCWQGLGVNGDVWFGNEIQVLELEMRWYEMV